jgi:hypothetical protein
MYDEQIFEFKNYGVFHAHMQIYEYRAHIIISVLMYLYLPAPARPLPFNHLGRIPP